MDNQLMFEITDTGDSLFLKIHIDGDRIQIGILSSKLVDTFINFMSKTDEFSGFTYLSGEQKLALPKIANIMWSIKKSA